MNPQPIPPDVQPENVPPQLTERNQWVSWRYNWDSDRGDEGQWTKVPVDVSTGGNASSTDPETWSSFEDALRYHQQEDTNTDGIGFMFSPDGNIVGIDIDSGRDPDSGNPNDLARTVIDTLDSYAEVSPSETGYHGYSFGSLPDKGNRNGNLEIYDQDRFFTVTGHHVDGTPCNVRHRYDVIREIHGEYIVSDDETDEKGQTYRSQQDNEPVRLDDSELIEKAKGATNGETFRQLWIGDTSGYESHSEARLALVNYLAFWTGKDREQMRRIFEQSQLAQQQLEKSMRDFDNYAAERAIRDCDDTYSASFESSHLPENEPKIPADGGRLTVSDPTVSTVIEAMRDLGAVGTADIESHPAVDRSIDQVRRAINYLEEIGVVESERSGRRVSYTLTDDR